MLVKFLETLRAFDVRATTREYLDLLRGLEAGVAHGSVDEFYQFSKACLVKNETHFDRFDRAFAAFWDGITVEASLDEQGIPNDWLKRLAEKHLTSEEMAEVEALGGFDKLLETLKKRIEEQEKRHQGGSKWIGTAGTSPFGAYGYNPEGVRIGQAESRHRKAVKVWEKRTFKDLDPNTEVGTRNMKVVLRRLRAFARQGVADELDLQGTIDATGKNAGYLHLKMRAERRNAVRVILLLDIGGSMDDHVLQVEQLFAAARSEFRDLSFFYFHNCVYEQLWTDNRRRQQTSISTQEMIRTYGPDHRIIFVGDATMSPYEVIMKGGSVEHFNSEPGADWIRRLTGAYPHVAWLNPQPEKSWPYYQSISMIQDLVHGRMFPLTLQGLTDGMRSLS